MKERITYLLPTDILKEKACSAFGIQALQDKSMIFCAAIEDEPVGIIYGVYTDLSSISILDIAVTPVLRNSGIGSSMVSIFLEHCYSEGINFIYVKYHYSKDASYNIEHFIDRTLPGKSKYEYSSFTISIASFGKYFSDRYFTIDTTKDIPGKLSLRFIEDLNHDEISRVAKTSEKMTSSYLWPLSGCRNIIKEISVLLFYGEVLIGWSVAIRSSYDKLTLSSTFISEKYRPLGLGPYLWSAIYNKFKKCDNLSCIKLLTFDFDKNEERTSSLYEMLFGNILIEHTEHYIRKINLS